MTQTADYLKLKKSNCKNCYKCIRNCPVKSIRFSDGQANIINEDCILCGHCFVACPQNAKEIREDIGAAKSLIASGAPVYASIAPSFVANYDRVTIGSLEKALLRLGFAGVEETAVGATIVKKQYDELVAQADGKVVISSCCHTINLLIQKYYPEALPCLAHVLSPMQAHSQDLKRRFPAAKTVFIGPCISKKEEAERYPGIVDCVLTFEELSSWLEAENIQLEYVEDQNANSRARLFPICGGILRTMDADNPDYSYMALDGIDNCAHALEDILSGKLTDCFIEMSACVGSCVGGPAMDKSHRAPVRDFIAVNRYAGKDHFQVYDYIGAALEKEMPPLAPREVFFSNSAIEEILRKIGKTSPEHELNCGSCGYNTCRDKARAVLLGKANLEMCLPYLKEKAESFSDKIIGNTPNAIIVMNEAMEVQQINAAACRLMNIHQPRDILGGPVVRILDPTPFMDVFQKNKSVYDKRSYLAEYRKYVDQTVIYDKDYHIIICIMRDVTEEARQREEKEAISRTTMEITDKVIEKQMRTVQEIASLLGETTAETKIALTKLKESLSHE
ncbi:[Fe-Fe] hydrogenase large subunit C-terminal domain-containing protein [Oscillospiraceae bacterium MB08-C2-2]|nr:[Fe-Fe] hydrogenase large subunit C-terminal domain-containing protein [Oscillospiraceae bacterium MB08-C2-2]